MSFYKNNIQRIRNDLKHLLTEDDVKNFMPCSKKSMCTIKDMISEDVKDVDIADTVNFDTVEVADTVNFDTVDIADTVKDIDITDDTVDIAEPIDDTVNTADITVNTVDTVNIDIDIKPETCNQELKFVLPPIDDDTDDIQNSDSESDILDSDIDEEDPKDIEIEMDDSDYETELNIIRDNETKLKRLKNDYFSNESIPITYEEDDDFVNNLIRRELKDSIYVNYNDKPYKVEINSAEPEEVYKDKIVDVDKQVCDKKYNNFEAFYENYILNNNEYKQLGIFNKIIANNLVQHPFLIDIVNQFREDIVEVWMTKFKKAQQLYQFVNFDSKKWIKRAETFIFNSKLKKPIIEYIHSIGSLIVLFDVELTFQLNKHLYKNIEFESIKPLNLKKEVCNVNELVQYHNYGKNISKILIQDIVDNISTNENINVMNLDINLYNKIFNTKLKKLEYCVEPDIQQKVNQYILEDNNFPDLLKQPIIYIDPDTHQVYIFEYHKLCKSFDEKNYINPYTDKPFEQEFIEQCLEKMKNINLCNYCKDNCSKQTLKTIYQDPNFGPITLKFCSVDCFSDIEWKPKVLLNTII